MVDGNHAQRCNFKPKVQGIDTEAEACDLGEVDEGSVANVMERGQKNGSEKEVEDDDTIEKSNCDFMCKLKRTMSNTKQATTDSTLDDKGIKITADSIQENARQTENDERDRAQAAAAARLSEKDAASEGVFANKM